VATRARANSLVGALAAHIHKCGTSLSLRGVVNSVLVAGSPVELRRVQEEHVVYGVGYLEERLGEVVYKVSPNSFFQVNTPLTELLYRHVVQAAALRPSDVVYDLFCGSGTIGLFLAKGMAGTVQPRHIIGIEVAKSSVSDARHNAEVNGVDFATFVHGDVGDVRRIIKEEGYPKPDVIVCDPARSGLSKRALESILVLAPRTLVYVSCDVSTQARDVKRLVGSGRYQVAQLKSFDMYPQTTHVEAVCTLTRI
jgi:23S rRNA (uracil1939-C5)-methyltransferase